MVVKLVPAQRAAIIARYVAGEVTTHIAADFGITHAYVRNLAAMAGIPPRVELPPSVPMRPREPLHDPTIPKGHRRLASGKVIRYVPPEAYPQDPYR